MAVGELNKQIVNETFNCAYSEEQFRKFILELLPSADFTSEIKRIDPNTQGNQFSDFIRRAKRICKYKYTCDEFGNEKVIDVLVVTLKRTSSVERARTAQRNFIARYLNLGRNYQKDAALVAFISEDEQGNISPDWRFSLVQMNYKAEIVEDEKGKKKRVITTELTPAKRFSFLVGENEDTHTAQQQFGACLEKSANGEKITIEDLVTAFDIEKVSKEFFEKYKSLYLKMRDELKRLCDIDEIVRKDFIEHNINIDDFAKKTMGQLVFLYFIQKKGWLGVAEGKDWGSGDKKFLSNIFKGQYCKYDNFFNDILEHLFYEALAKDRTDKKDLFDILNCRIPFLNGGLFEPVNGYEWTKTDLTIDNNIFKEIFETFDLYNFTVKEDEPLEKEVAIDPEMLGKVFENLLPENIRKGNGAFYTPREIVHYMCQESLINYLYNKINIKEVELSPQEQAEQQKLFKAKKIEQLKLTQEVIEEIIPKEDIEFFIKTGSSTYVNKSRKLNVTLPDTITNNALILDKALFDIKVCDPAIGSGAFPVGMMNEIVRARAALSEYIGKPDRSIYELKRNAIENSIYGVDIDAGAVDIAKLRFWLSLVVDEEDIKNIKPLPNLDYKIMQGNSLISSYEGIDFDTIVDEYKPDTQFTINLWGDKSQDLKLELKNKQSEFLKTPYATRKIELKKEIEDIIINIVKAKLEVKAKEGKLNLQEMEDKIRNFAQNTENRNFFPWKLFFADAFEQGGFDVVIGNPPYIQLQKFKGQPVQQLYKNANFKVHDSNGDIYCLFYEKGLSLLKHNGNLCFITSNKWMRAGYGEKLREFFVSNNPVELIDFGGFGVFDTATVDVNILLIQKHQNDNKTYSCSLDKNFEGLNQLSVYIRQNSTIQNFDKNTWCILNPIEQSIKSKIEEIGTPLKDWNINIYRGVLTGLNEAFIIDGAKKDELIAKDPKSAEIIRPILRGRDIKRYSYEFADKWLINTHNGSKTQEKIDINDYPVLKEHFDNYYEKLVKRDDQGDTPYNLRCCAYMDDFSKQKIVYSEIVQKPQFYLDQGKFFVEATSFLLTGENLEYLVACFNSKPVTYFFKTFYAGGGLGEKGYRYKKAFLVNLPIPKIKNINYNNDIFKELILQNKTDKIDKIIYEIYNLSSDEIEYIENYYDI
jgi:hypothetical protein